LRCSGDGLDAPLRRSDRAQGGQPPYAVLIPYDAMLM
jgi:hypothetical protein